MLDVVKSARATRLRLGSTSKFCRLRRPIRLIGCTRPTPPRARRELYPHLKRLWRLYDNTGIETRYNCEPIEWYLQAA